MPAVNDRGPALPTTFLAAGPSSKGGNDDRREPPGAPTPPGPRSSPRGPSRPHRGRGPPRPVSVSSPGGPRPPPTPPAGGGSRRRGRDELPEAIVPFRGSDAGLVRRIPRPRKPLRRRARAVPEARRPAPPVCLSRGTLRFTPAHPMPSGPVRRLVRARRFEVAGPSRGRGRARPLGSSSPGPTPTARGYARSRRGHGRPRTSPTAPSRVRARRRRRHP